MKETTYRGKVITEDDVLRAMDRFDAEVRLEFPESRWKTYAIEHNSKLYPPKQLLRIATGIERIGSGGTPINSRFEELGFPVVYLDASKTDFEDELEEEASISLEVDIENALVANLEQLEIGLRLYRANGKTGQQFQIKFDAKKQGRIDILAIDTSDNFVVIEIKAGEADRDVCGQIQGYMGWVKANLSGNKPVRGIVIANDFTARLVYASKVVADLQLKKCQISFRFVDA